MRRVLRHFFTLCSALSLLLCVAVCVLWVRSYWVRDYVSFLESKGGMGPSTSVSSNRGQVVLERLFATTEPLAVSGTVGSPEREAGFHYTRHTPYVRGPYVKRSDPGIKAQFGAGAFKWFWTTGGTGVQVTQVSPTTQTTITWFMRGQWEIGVPHWLLAGVLLLMALPTLIRRMRRRPKPGSCPKCGYDLRGHEQGGPVRCPECGTPSLPAV